jgi:integrase
MSNGFGGVVKLGGNRRKPYGARVTVAWKEGKQKYKYIGYFETPKEALAALVDYNRDPYDLGSTTVTFADMFERWKASKEDELTRVNLMAYEAAFNNSKVLHNLEFVKIRAEHLKNCMKACSKSHATKSKMKQLWNQMYNYAVENDLKVTNYSQFVKLKADAPKDKKIFTATEVTELWNRQSDVVEITLILLYTGLRVGELLEIELENVHLEDRYMIGGLKTDAGRNRVIPIHERVVPFIERRLATNNKYLVEFEGHKYSYNTFRTHWKQEFGTKHNCHDTRKSCISFLHEKEVPIETIRVIVGHAQKGVTEQRYLKKSIESLVKAINKLD